MQEGTQPVPLISNDFDLDGELAKDITLNNEVNANIINATEATNTTKPRGWLYSSILNTLTATTRTIAGSETEEALTQVLELLEQFFAGHNERYSVDAFLSLFLLAIYYKTPRLRTGIVEDSEITIRESYHYFKFSAVAYGWKLMNGLMFDNKEHMIMRGFLTGDQQNNSCICEHTGIRPEDIIATKWTSSDFHPAHFVAVDHCTESIVLAIRGTFHIKDALTDLIAHSVPFLDGKVHNGMLKCATKKIETVKQILLDSLKKYEGYRLVVVGHSLGAGTAAVISLLLKREYPTLDIQCFAYAPPCVFDISLANMCRNFIKSFVLENDVVPRLSYGSMESLKDSTIRLMGQSTSNFHRLVQAFAAGGPQSEAMSKRVAGILSYDSHVVDTKIIEDIRGPYLEDKLFPPGYVCHILRDKHPKYNSPPLYHMEFSDGAGFAEIIVSSDMFLDHMPNAYNKAFEGILRHQSLVRHGLLACEHQQFDIYPCKEKEILLAAHESDVKRPQIN